MGECTVQALAYASIFIDYLAVYDIITMHAVTKSSKLNTAALWDVWTSSPAFLAYLGGLQAGYLQCMAVNNYQFSSTTKFPGIAINFQNLFMQIQVF